MTWVFLGGLILLLGLCVKEFTEFKYGSTITVIGTIITLFSTWKHNQASSNKTTDIKQEVIDLKKENATLSAQLLGAQQTMFKYMTGHDSYCTVEIFPQANGKADVYIDHRGEYPLSNIKISIFNSTEVDNGRFIQPTRHSATLNFERGPDYDNREIISLPEIPDLQPNTRRKIGSIDCTRENQIGFMITISARNGTWYERFLIWPNMPIGTNDVKFNRIYSVLKIDPNNPQSSPKQPKTLAVIESTPIPDHITLFKDKYDWFGNNWF
ncbi:hypothetical protein [Siphonobacter sp. BAB-5385]|uniref:hypothetical protein n=1 Tax=Siphonobacter sp. BAB-5385 TaxID=1864822 RepID=UPI00113FDC87|nr:hypothetical protein [Siphonobacter sp. BAB-5385]